MVQISRQAVNSEFRLKIALYLKKKERKKKQRAMLACSFRYPEMKYNLGSPVGVTYTKFDGLSDAKNTAHRFVIL